MKRNLLFFSALIALFTVLNSCKNNREIELREFTYADKLYFTSDTSLGNLQVNIDVYLPVKFHNTEVMTNIQKQIISKIFNEKYTHVAVDSVIPSYIDNIKSKYIKEVAEDFNDDEIKGNKLNEKMELKGYKMYESSKLFSYCYESFIDMHSVHGVGNRQFYNFDLSDGHLIKEDEIFIDGYDDALTKLIKEQIVEQSAEIESVGDLDDYNFWSDEIHPNGNFYVTPTGLVYVYNPYEIAPYSMGQIEVMLSYDKLKPIMQKGNILEDIYSSTK